MEHYFKAKITKKLQIVTQGGMPDIFTPSYSKAKQQRLIRISHLIGKGTEKLQTRFLRPLHPEV